MTTSARALSKERKLQDDNRFAQIDVVETVHVHAFPKRAAPSDLPTAHSLWRGGTLSGALAWTGSSCQKCPPATDGKAPNRH